jgi:acyl carrier protein
MVSDALKQLLLRELRLDDFEIGDDTTADRVPGWDSLTHVRILAAVEASFGVRFSTLEAIRIRNVGELQALIDRKTAR